MNYRDTLDYLFSQLPMFQKVGATAFNYKLDKTKRIVEILGNPHNKLRFIHIAGTNGKGSVSHFLASILQESGYKVGLYTSPHLVDFRERIKINGEMISEEKVIDFVEKYKPDLAPIQASFFEYSFGMAIDYFAQEEVDIVVLETGMGGRLDSTNIVQSLLTIITNIGLDHTQFLGTTLEEIAKEKAGIFKKGIPMIIGETQPELESLFQDYAKRMESELVFADKNLVIKKEETVYQENVFLLILDVWQGDAPLYKLKTKLSGEYQKKNILTSLCAIQRIQEMGFEISKKNILDGFYKVLENTKFLGRWQILNTLPLTICDTAHNKEGLSIVMHQLEMLSYAKLHIVFGTVADKNINKILPLLPKKAEYYFCKANVPRALDAKTLQHSASEIQRQGKAYANVSEAYRKAKENAKPDDVIFIGGSTFVVGEVL